ncbi:MAG: radical SAM protein [Oscillospiraceae bacterium]|nr:radical SAM protein [Oscillospiraceae bacterium]
MNLCNLCPRGCNIDRNARFGYCRAPELPMVARAAPHFGEEPCITGTRGSGTVFFSGCNLRCVFCQNHTISRGQTGSVVTVERLADIFRELQSQGVHNINLVTGSHYTRQIAEALDLAKLRIPVAWNSSGYDSVESLKLLEGKVQIYMPDFKYSDPILAKTYSAAADYPQIAAAAIAEMYRQTGPFAMDDDGILQKGVLVRHLILPNRPTNTKGVIDTLTSLLPKGSYLFSLMSQYTPMPGLEDYPELQQTVSPALADFCYRYMLKKGIEDGYYQDPDSATEDMIPAFDLTGV